MKMRRLRKTRQPGKQYMYVPSTPGGTMLLHLAGDTEEQAWKYLMAEASHMPYVDKEGFQQRGYTVDKMEGCAADWAY